MSKRFDTEDETYNSEGVECPFCGWVNRDSWELGDGGEGCGEIECGECEKTFVWERCVSVNYTGRKLKND